MVLAVTQRPNKQVSVPVALGFTPPRRVTVPSAVGDRRFLFYAQCPVAFAHDGAEVVAALGAASGVGRDAADRVPMSSGLPRSQQRSLRGFSAAYVALSRTCPEGN